MRETEAMGANTRSPVWIRLSAACATGTHTKRHTDRRRGSFSGQSSRCLRARFAAICFEAAHTDTAPLSPPAAEDGEGKMSLSPSHTRRFQTEQVKPALVVFLNGSVCVIRLLTGAEEGSGNKRDSINFQDAESTVKRSSKRKRA